MLTQILLSPSFGVGKSPTKPALMASSSPRIGPVPTVTSTGSAVDTPFCTAQLYTQGKEIVKEDTEHNQPPSHKEFITSSIVSTVKYDVTTATPRDVLRHALAVAPHGVKALLLSTKHRCGNSRRSPTLLLMKSYRSSYPLSTDFPSSPLVMSWMPGRRWRPGSIYSIPPLPSQIWSLSTSYPISMGNITSAVENDEPRTNNASEGGNNALNRAFNASHPSMWTSTLRKSHAEVETKYQQMSVGTATSEPVSKRWRVREARIKHVVESYNPVDKLDFLSKIGYLFWIYSFDITVLCDILYFCVIMIL